MQTSKELIELFISEAPKLKTAISNFFGELNEDQLNSKPLPGKWSIGECIDHLVISHDQYLKKIRKVKIEKISKCEDSKSYKHTILGKLLVDSVSPEATRKLKTFSVFKPSHKIIDENIVDDYHRSLDNLVEMADKFKGYDLRKIKISSPVSSFIRLNLGEAFLIHLNHDRRHINQANRVLEKLKVYH